MGKANTARASDSPVSVISPSIGRRLWLKFSDIESAAKRGVTVFDQDQAVDAGVIFVHDDHKVNVFVTDHAGNGKPLMDVHLKQPGDEEIDPSEHPDLWLEWMPYQVKSA